MIIQKGRVGFIELFSLTSISSIVPHILPKIYFAAFIGLIASLVNDERIINSDKLYNEVSYDYSPFGALGIALSLFLGFRNNSCFTRWWEGRIELGKQIEILRHLGRIFTARGIKVCHQRRVLYLVLAHIIALKEQLRATALTIPIRDRSKMIELILKQIKNYPYLNEDDLEMVRSSSYAIRGRSSVIYSSNSPRSYEKSSSSYDNSKNNGRIKKNRNRNNNYDNNDKGSDIIGINMNSSTTNINKSGSKGLGVSNVADAFLRLTAKELNKLFKLYNTDSTTTLNDNNSIISRNRSLSLMKYYHNITNFNNQNQNQNDISEFNINNNNNNNNDDIFTRSRSSSLLKYNNMMNINNNSSSGNVVPTPTPTPTTATPTPTTATVTATTTDNDYGNSSDINDNNDINNSDSSSINDSSSIHDDINNGNNNYGSSSSSGDEQKDEPPPPVKEVDVNQTETDNNNNNNNSNSNISNEVNTLPPPPSTTTSTTTTTTTTPPPPTTTPDDDIVDISHVSHMNHINLHHHNYNNYMNNNGYTNNYTNNNYNNNIENNVTFNSAQDDASVDMTLMLEVEFDSFFLTSLSDQIKQLSSVQIACERISTTPLPHAYNLLVVRSLFLYILMVPFAIAPGCGYSTIVLNMIIAYVFFGLNELSRQLEDPFTEEPHSLALDALTRSCEVSVCEMLGEDAPFELEPDEVGLMM